MKILREKYLNNMRKNHFLKVKNSLLELEKDIDSAGFMATSLSNVVDNLTEGIQKIKCKDCDCFLKYESAKDNLTKCKSLSCNSDYSNKIGQELKKRFMNTFKFSNNDINKFILLLRKGVCPYEYMDYFEKVNETSKRRIS